MKKSVFIFLAPFLSAYVMAGVVPQTNLTIEKVRSLGGSNQKLVAFQTTSNLVPGGLSCQSDYYTVEEEDNSEFAMSILLTALTTGKKVELYVYDNKCSVTGRISVRDVRILK